MKDSRQLVNQACAGVRPERTPIFDLLANDAVVEHFAGRPLDGSADFHTMLMAAGNALDGTRCISAPEEEGRTWTDETGTVHVARRWTSWVKSRALNTVDEWSGWIERHIETMEQEEPPSAARQSQAAEDQRLFDAGLNGTLYIHCTPSTALNTAHCLCGLEMFSYLLADEPDLVNRWLRALERQCAHHIALAGHVENCPLAMIYSDVAYKQRLMFSRDSFNQMGFFDDVASICQQCHDKGLKVIFHSDGCIMDILPDLVAVGIDGLNPIEKAAGMDIYAIRQRYPELIILGGLDVTHLLPTGSPEEVRSETRRMINEVGSEGHLLIGSSTELDCSVPLVNYLAFYDEVMRG